MLCITVSDNAADRIAARSALGIRKHSATADSSCSELGPSSWRNLSRCRSRAHCGGREETGGRGASGIEHPRSRVHDRCVRDLISQFMEILRYPSYTKHYASRLQACCSRATDVVGKLIWRSWLHYAAPTQVGTYVATRSRPSSRTVCMGTYVHIIPFLHRFSTRFGMRLGATLRIPLGVTARQATAVQNAHTL